MMRRWEMKVIVDIPEEVMEAAKNGSANIYDLCGYLMNGKAIEPCEEAGMERNCDKCVHRTTEQMRTHEGDVVTVEGCDSWECEPEANDSDYIFLSRETYKELCRKAEAVDKIRADIEKVTRFGISYQPIEHGALMSIFDDYLKGEEH
jgi:hypothetical protein